MIATIVGNAQSLILTPLKKGMTRPEKNRLASSSRRVTRRINSKFPATPHHLQKSTSHTNALATYSRYPYPSHTTYPQIVLALRLGNFSRTRELFTGEQSNDVNSSRNRIPLPFRQKPTAKMPREISDIKNVSCDFIFCC